MTLTLPSDTPKRLDLSMAYPKEYPQDRAPIRHLTDWFDNHPPEAHPVRIKPVEKRPDPMREAVAELVPDRTKPVTHTVTQKEHDRVIHERDLWRERFWLALWAAVIIFASLSCLGYRQMQRIRAYQAASEGRAHAVVVSSPTEPGSSTKSDPAPQGGTR